MLLLVELAIQGAARRLNAQKKSVEIESVSEQGKPDPRQGTVRKYYRLEVNEFHVSPILYTHLMSTKLWLGS